MSEENNSSISNQEKINKYNEDINKETKNNIENLEKNNYLKNEEEEKSTNFFKKIDLSKSNKYDFIFKVALIGDSGIGKTSILIRFVDDTFKMDTTSTIGVDFRIVSFEMESKLAKMQIWDTCGSERFKSITSSFIKSCSVFVLVFDLTKKKSFLNLENWMKMIKENIHPKLLCLVGNKSDLPGREVSQEEAIKFSTTYDLKYLETSAMNSLGIENLFKYIAENLMEDTNRKYGKKSIINSDNSKKFQLGDSENLYGNGDNGNKDNNSDNEDGNDNTTNKNKNNCKC